MPEPGEGGAAPVADSGGGDYLSALQADADQSFAALDAPTEAPIDVPVSETTEDAPASETVELTPESIDAQLAGDDNEPITRRNAKDLVTKAREAEREAIKRAEQAEKDRIAAEERQQALIAQAQQFVPPKEHYDAVFNAVKRRDWTTLDTIRWTDERGQEQQGFNSIDAALEYLDTLDRRTEQSAGMLEYWRQAFMQRTGSLWAAMADRDGIDKSVLLGEDFAKSLEHLYDAGKASGESEWRGKYDALKAEYDALRARAGSLSAEPESGGNGMGTALPRTVRDIERMGLDEFEKNFDRILQALPR